MALKKKNKNETSMTKSKFFIPQIDESYEGLKKAKPAFKKSAIGSVFFGSQVADVIAYKDNAGNVDIKKAYDAFRPTNEKRISEEELIKEHGTKYYEFQMLSNKSREEAFGTIYENNNSHNNNSNVKKDQKIGFSFVQTKDEFTSFEPKNVKVEDSKPINLEFNIDLDDEYEYGSFSPKLEKPKSQNIPKFLFDKDKDDDIEKEIYENKPIHIERKEVVIEKEDKFINNPIENNELNQDEYEEVVDSYDDYKLPPTSLFKHAKSANEEFPKWLLEKKDIINEVLTAFDIDGEVVTYTKGPAFTRYEISLASGVKVNKITAIYDNLQMALQAKSIRLLAPIPGKSTIGIEVPNDVAEVVNYGDIMTSEFIEKDSPLLVALGKDIDGKPIFKAIDDMPHCLVAGATKSGKSVCINTILISLLVKNRPDELKLILIDPKTVELSFYSELPHLITPVITEPSMASESLKWAVEEMERRYQTLSATRVRNIQDYNKKAKSTLGMKKMSYIVIVIDELADLMMQCGADVEDSIKRITQKARAAGIHLIVATQRPTVDVVSGTIKANIPGRIAFKVADFINSNTILDEGGAETLLGRGDMLIKDNDLPIRVQGAYISDDEINSTCDFIRNQVEPNYIFTHEDLEKKVENVNYPNQINNASESEDVLYEIARFCLETSNCSINAITQQFHFSFNRAQRIVTILEARKIVSAKNGTKSREILVDTFQLDEIFGKSNF